MICCRLLSYLTAPAVRIRNDALRIACLVMLEPFCSLGMVIDWSLPVAWGGHPDGRRIFAPDAWAFHFDNFLAACYGYFVEEPRS